MEDGADDEHHGEFDAQSLREHEEFTKVKNVAQIELGRHLMDTWYFSPLPPEFKDCKVGHWLGLLCYIFWVLPRSYAQDLQTCILSRASSCQ